MIFSSPSPFRVFDPLHRPHNNILPDQSSCISLVSFPTHINAIPPSRKFSKTRNKEWSGRKRLCKALSKPSWPAPKRINIIQTGFIGACRIKNKTIYPINALQVFRNIHDGNLITSDSRRFARCDLLWKTKGRFTNQIIPLAWIRKWKIAGWWLKCISNYFEGPEPTSLTFKMNVNESHWNKLFCIIYATKLWDSFSTGTSSEWGFWVDGNSYNTMEDLFKSFVYLSIVIWRGNFALHWDF